MGFYLFTNGTVADADEVDANNSALAGAIAQSNYQVLQSNDVFDNKDNLAADEFTDSTGTNNTINAGATTSDYDSSNLYYVLGINDEASGDTLSDPDSFTNASNAFDNDDTTFANKSSTSAGTVTQTLGRTFGAKTVNFVKYACKLTQSDKHNFAKMWFQTYNGSVWSDHTTILNDTSNNDIAFDSGILSGVITVSASIQGVRIKFESDVNNTGITTQHYLYTLEYGDYNSSSLVICDTATLTLDGTEKAISVYADVTHTANTSLTVKAGDGTLQTAANTIATTSNICDVFDISALGSGTLDLEFSLATTDTSETPTFRGWGVTLLR